MVLALLAPACATVSGTQGQSPESDTGKPYSTIIGPIHCTRIFSTLHDETDKPSNTPACNQPVPDAVDQTVVFTETIRKKLNKGPTAHSLDTTINPIKNPMGDCETTDMDQWIVPAIASSNENLIGLFLGSDGGTHGTANAEKTLINREIRYVAEQKSVIRKILKGYRIQRTPEGIRFQTKVMKCDR
jgi:hypothetical protein